MIVIGSNTSDNGQSRFTEDVSHFMELRQNRQLALLKRSAKNGYTCLQKKSRAEFSLPLLISFNWVK